MYPIREGDGAVTVATLCGVQGCCPTVEINRDSGKVVIKDDDGGQVTLTMDEWRDARTRVDLDI